MQYDSQIKKTLKILEQENKNTIDSNSLQKTEIQLFPENFHKSLVKINVVSGYDMLNQAGGTFYKLAAIESSSSGNMVIIVELPNFPEWAVPMTKIIPMFYVEDAWDTSDPTFSWFADAQVFWKRIDNTNFELRIILDGGASITQDSNFTNLPFFLNLDLVFNNERKWEALNPNKT